MANNSMMVNQAAPNTHPGGVQGAKFCVLYHSLVTGLPIKKAPKASAPKFSARNMMNLISITNQQFNRIYVYS